MKIGDKVKVVKGEYTAWEGEILDLYGSSWVAVDIRYYDKHGAITVPPDFLKVLEPANIFPDPEQWDYYTPDDEDDA